MGACDCRWRMYLVIASNKEKVGAVKRTIVSLNQQILLLTVPPLFAFLLHSSLVDTVNLTVPFSLLTALTGHPQTKRIERAEDGKGRCICFARCSAWWLQEKERLLEKVAQDVLGCLRFYAHSFESTCYIRSVRLSVDRLAGTLRSTDCRLPF